ncbi:hypothetical protein ACIQXF_01765 [Lysinibacillus sp. NPDC097231]|uniref:hypothetical protein n=1 Tax=Lysinibacillus sp. NPDC097231 TaxID=3364142 RepID=UPI0038071323
MKKLLIFLSLLVLLCIGIWTLVYFQYKEYSENNERNHQGSKNEIPSKEGNFETFIDGEYVKIPNKEEVVGQELYDYLHDFLFEVIDANFSTHVGKSIDARMFYNEGKIDLNEAIMTQDNAYTEVGEAIQNFQVPKFENSSPFEMSSLQTINREIQGIQDAYERQISGQKLLTFVIAKEKGEDLIDPNGYASLEEEREIAQKLVDESLDEILEFEKKVDELCYEIIYRMERK